jgi:hypothetical protein
MGDRNASGPATEYGEPTPDVVGQLGGEINGNAHTPASNVSQARRQLGAVLRDLKEETGLGLKDLTVLSAVNDPFRLDTPSNHREGLWLQKQMQALGYLRPGRSIHNRGLHYALVSTGSLVLPNGRPYINDIDCWDWLEGASKAARWLGYVPWESIEDARNTEPVIRPSTSLVRFNPSCEAGIEELHLPHTINLIPTVDGFCVRQQYRLVFWGEKTSLGAVLRPLADAYDADLYLPSGETSDTQLHKMAQVGAEDGREMVVFVFADCDPAGYQMAVSMAHKLRALQISKFDRLRFQLHTPALTVEQVKELGLPSTPLKETELRADGWRRRYGVEQTEIDALATLRPDVLRKIVQDAVDPFYDRTLASRVNDAKQDALDWAEQQLQDQLADDDEYQQAQTDATNALDAARKACERLREIVDSIDLAQPEQDPIEPEIGETPLPLVSSDMPLEEAIRILRDRKDYSGGA